MFTIGQLILGLFTCLVVVAGLNEVNEYREEKKHACKVQKAYNFISYKL